MYQIFISSFVFNGLNWGRLVDRSDIHLLYCTSPVRPAAAEEAPASKSRKYEDLSPTHLFVPVGIEIETLGPISRPWSITPSAPGRAIPTCDGVTSFLFQRIYVLFNVLTRHV